MACPSFVRCILLLDGAFSELAPRRIQLRAVGPSVVGCGCRWLESLREVIWLSIDFDTAVSGVSYGDNAEVGHFVDLDPVADTWNDLEADCLAGPSAGVRGVKLQRRQALLLIHVKSGNRATRPSIPLSGGCGDSVVTVDR
jgi:hypothetical protein